MFKGENFLNRIILIILAGFILYVLFRLLFPSEEYRILKFIQKGKNAAQEENILICASMISNDYRDRYDNNRDSLIYIAREVFDYYEDIFIKIQDLEISLDESKCKAEVKIRGKVLCRTKDNKTESIFEAETGEVLVKLIKEGRNWKLIEIELLEEITLMGQKIA